MLLMRIGLGAALAIATLTGPASADVLFTDGTFNLANYQASPTFTTDSSITLTAAQCPSCGNPGSALQFTVTFATTEPDLAALGEANTTFAYDPLTQGAITGINASVDKNFIINTATTGSPNTFRPLILQDGTYYLGGIPGPTLVAGPGGGQTGYNLISQTALTAADFTSFDFSTGTFGSANPNFAGDPMLLGLGQIFSNGVASEVAMTQYDNLSLDVITTAAVPEPSSAALFGVAVLGLVCCVAWQGQRARTAYDLTL